MNTDSKLVITSFFMIILGVANHFLSLLCTALHAMEKFKNFTLSFASNSSKDSVLSLFGTAVSIKSLFDGSVGFMTVLQILAGILGIAFVVMINLSKTQEFAKRTKAVIFIAGILSCLVGAFTFAAIVLYKIHLTIVYILMFITLIVMPILFTVVSNKFRKGE